MHEADPLEWLLDTTDDERAALLASLSAKERREWRWHWGLWRRPSQAAPAGDWRVWLILAGRGFGKTRTGAQWVQDIAETTPDARIALVAATLPESRGVMVEGESGLLSVGAPWRRPTFEPSLRRLVWRNGAQATLYSASEPESLRGPQHSHAFRAGAKRGDDQRGVRPCRYAAPCRYRRGTISAPHNPGCRSDLADRPGGTRRMGRTDRAACGVERGRVALHSTSSRYAPLRSAIGRNVVFRQPMANCAAPARASGWQCRRCGGTPHTCDDPRRSRQTGNFFID